MRVVAVACACVALGVLSGCTCVPCTRSNVAKQAIAPDPDCTNLPLGPQVLTAIDPARAVVGDAEFRLSATGTGFAADSKVCWNGEKRATRYIDAQHLKAHILFSDLAAPGKTLVRVFNPASKTISNELEFEIISPTIAPTVDKTTGKTGLVDPATLTIGAISEALKAALDHLNQVLQDAGQTMISVGQSLEGSGHALLGDLDARLKDKLSYTLGQLQKEEHQLASDAVALTEKVNMAANQLAINAAAQARLTMAEADQFAYAAEQNLPCQPHVGRVTYATSSNTTDPFDLRLGVDAPQIKVHGNWLDLKSKPAVTIDGHQCDVGAAPICKVSSQGERDLLVDVADNAIGEPATPAGRDVPISVETAICEPSTSGAKINPGHGPGETVIHVFPHKNYNVQASWYYTAMVDSAAQWDWQQSFYYQRESCAGGTPLDQTYNLPDPVTYNLVAESYAQVSTTVAICDSGVDGSPIYNSNSSVTIRAHSYSCGQDCIPIVNICNCKGRGRLGYNVNFHYTRHMRQVFSVTEDRKVITGGQGQPVVFHYSGPLPPAGSDPEWHWDVKVVVTQGGQETTYELTDDVPNSNGITTSANVATGDLTVVLPGPLTRKLAPRSP